MSKIERRFATVRLHNGHYQQALADLHEQAVHALSDEDSGVTQQRHGTRSKAAKLAAQYDALQREAEETSTTITVYALRFDEMEDLQEEHPPRDGEDRDKIFGVNMKTFPRVLAAAALVAPGVAADLEDLKVKGTAALAELELSLTNYRKIEAAAWNVNVGDDEIPKESLVSLLRQAREAASKPQPDLASAPQSSRDASQQRPTSTTTPPASTPDEPSSSANQSGTTAPDPAP